MALSVLAGSVAVGGNVGRGVRVLSKATFVGTLELTSGVCVPLITGAEGLETARVFAGEVSGVTDGIIGGAQLANTKSAILTTQDFLCCRIMIQDFDDRVREHVPWGPETEYSLSKNYFSYFKLSKYSLSTSACCGSATSGSAISGCHFFSHSTASQPV